MQEWALLAVHLAAGLVGKLLLVCLPEFVAVLKTECSVLSIRVFRVGFYLLRLARSYTLFSRKYHWHFENARLRR